MVWSLRDCIGKLSLARHAKCHLLIEKYLKDLIKIINDVSDCTLVVLSIDWCDVLFYF